jgi:3-oxoacyl-[acyl-carrier-protein] synthase-1
VKLNLVVTAVSVRNPAGCDPLTLLHSIRTGITRLNVQPYPDLVHQWLVGGDIMTWIPLIHERRLRFLLAECLRDAWRSACNDQDPSILQPAGLLLGLPETIRPGYRFPSKNFKFAPWLTAVALPPVLDVEIFEGGNCSAQLALARAAQLLHSNRLRSCFIGAVDTQWQIQILRWHESHSRLKCSYFDDGLMPGEACCFLVLEKEENALARGALILARTLATDSDIEMATVLTDQPNAAKALTKAARTALNDAAIKVEGLDAVWSDLNGESYRGREWAFTEVRLSVPTHTELFHPADCHGDLGAATDANLLALAVLAQATGWAQGKPQLVFAGSEGGLRAVTVIGPPPQQKTPALPQVMLALPHVIAPTPEVLTLGPDEIDFTQRDDPPRAYFEWQLRQEHLDSLATLHYQRKAILLDPTILWPRLREPEQRILNHLDAVVAGGLESIWAVASGLLDGEEGKAFAGALLLSTLPTPANLARLDEALKPLPPVLAGIEAGLRHAPVSTSLILHVETWLDHADPAVRAMAVSVLGYRREMDLRRIVLLIKSDDPRLRLAGIRAARQQGYKSAAPALEGLLSNNDAVVLRETLLTLLCLGHRNAPVHCRNLAVNGSKPAAHAPWLLALAGQLADLPVLVRASKILEDPVALSALGILGNVQAVPYLFQALDASDEAVKVAAAEALELLTASGLREQAVLVEKTELFPGEVLDERREVERVATAVDVWREWWHQHSRNFDPRRRWRRGQPCDFGVVLAELAAPATRFHDRQRAYWELLILTGQSFPFEPDWFVPRQQQALAEWDSWWAAHKPH